MTSDDIGLPQSPAQAAETVIDRVARALHISCCRQDIDGYLGAKIDCTVLAEVALAALSAEAAGTIAAARKQVAEDTARLDWLEANSNAEISYEGWEDDVWQVHTVNGGRSDREWTLRGEGVTVRQAIDTAIETLRLRAEDQQKAAATPTIADPDGEARS